MFGKFKNIEEFLESYTKKEQQAKMEQINSLPMEQQVAALSKQQVADVAEVKATIKQREPDDKSTPKHYQMVITLDEIIQSVEDIKDDIQQCKEEGSPVFVAIRFGDRLGINQPIKNGMDEGDKLHLKGQWIPKDKAYSHGGEKMAVLHFTHHPAGFTCTAEKCYS